MLSGEEYGSNDSLIAPQVRRLIYVQTWIFPLRFSRCHISSFTISKIRTWCLHTTEGLIFFQQYDTWLGSICLFDTFPTSFVWFFCTFRDYKDHYQPCHIDNFSKRTFRGNYPSSRAMCVTPLDRPWEAKSIWTAYNSFTSRKKFNFFHVKGLEISLRASRPDAGFYWTNDINYDLYVWTGALLDQLQRGKLFCVQAKPNLFLILVIPAKPFIDSGDTNDASPLCS